MNRSTFIYDAASQVTTAQNQFSTVTRAYDAAGHLTWENQNLGALVNKKVQFEYDAGGKTTRLYVNATDYHDLDFRYDAMGRFEKIFNSDGALWFQYSYDKASNETQRFNAFNSVAQIYTRDPLNRISRLDVKRLTTTISYEAYGFDAMSRVLTIDREDGKRDLFGYNFAGELTSAKYGLVNGVNPTRSVSYALDEAGNRESVTDGGTTNYITDTINRYTLVGASGVVAGPAHQIGAYQANNYQYVGDSYLASVTAGSSTYVLGYDALGRCVKRTSNGVTTTYYVYDGARPIMEYKQGGALAGSNEYGKGIDEILMRGDYVVLTGGQGYFYQQNYLGSVTHLTGWAGEVIEKYGYDAFGQPTTTYTAGVFNNRFKFTGREHQPTFGIYEYRNRAYHPGLGRFLSEDPIGFYAGDTNMFRYCGGDPVNWIDPFGLKEVTKQTEDINPGPSGYGQNGYGDSYWAENPNGAIYNPNEGQTIGGQVIGDTFYTDSVFSDGSPGPSGRGSNAGVPGGLSNSATGLTTSSGGRGSSSRDGRGPGGANRGSGTPTRGGNPYLASGPIIAELHKGFRSYNLPDHAAFWEGYANWVPDFIPGMGAVSRATRATVNVVSRPRTVQRALTLAERWLGPGYVETHNGVFRSADRPKAFEWPPEILIRDAGR